MDLTAIGSWISIVTALSTLIMGGLMWRMRGEFASRVDHSALAGKVEAAEQAIAGIESKLDGVPSHKEVAAIREDIAHLNGEVKVMAERIDGVKGVLERFEYPLNMLLKNHLEGTGK